MSLLVFCFLAAAAAVRTGREGEAGHCMDSVEGQRDALIGAL